LDCSLEQTLFLDQSNSVETRHASFINRGDIRNTIIQLNLITNLTSTRDASIKHTAHSGALGECTFTGMATFQAHLETLGDMSTTYRPPTSSSHHVQSHNHHRHPLHHNIQPYPQHQYKQSQPQPQVNYSYPQTHPRAYLTPPGSSVSPRDISPPSSSKPQIHLKNGKHKAEDGDGVGKWMKEGPVKNACLSCRTKKAKCDGQLPVCGQVSTNIKYQS
jgi:hypothetical protein